MQKNHTNTNDIKFQKVDNPDKISEDVYIKSYNEDFYRALQEKTSYTPLTDENKLFYHFEQNINASVSSTTGQLQTTYDEIEASYIDIGKHIKLRKEEVKKVEEIITGLYDEVFNTHSPYIAKIREHGYNFLADQKSENFKFMKEISTLEKDKVELQNAIYACLGKLNRLEKAVGIRAKAYTYTFDQSLNDNDINSKVIIKREDI